MIKLSILVCTVPSRLGYFYPRIMKHLLQQTADRDDVEILGLFYNKKRTIGSKRQGMVNLAQGQYLTFIDDDDRIADDYIELIMKTLYDHPDVDCVVYNVICNINNSFDKLCKYGIEFEYGDINGGLEWRGKPAHTMVYKSSIAKNHLFMDMNRGEDVNWVVRACKDIVSQVRIDKVLYYYDANYSTTSEMAELSEKVIEYNIKQLIAKENGSIVI